MRAYLRCLVAAGSLAIALGGCGDGDSDMSNDPLVGSWSLESIGGNNLPTPVTFTGGLVFTVNSGSADVSGDGTFEATYLGTVAGIAATAVVDGTWDRNGATYSVSGNVEVNGTQLGPVTETGTLNGTTLTLGAEVWQKD